MKALILGPGALGCSLLRSLSRVQTVQLSGPRPPRGAEFLNYWSPVTPEFLDEPTQIWLACKASQTATLIERTLLPLCLKTLPEVLAQSVLIAPQNGLGISSLLRTAKLPLAACRAAVWFGARWQEDTLIESPPPRRITVSSADGKETEKFAARLTEKLTENLRDTLTRAGFVAEFVRGEESPFLVEWKKALTSIALNPVVALARVTNGELLKNSELELQARHLQDEAFSLLEKLNLRRNDQELSREQAWKDLIQTCQETAANRNSMLQDLEAGRPLELPWLNEWILSEAQRLGLDLPVHRKIVEALRRLSPR
jgi:2-dehydropantoate 2-reductase